MIPAWESTRIGALKPNSTIDAAICATCSGEWVRAFLAYGTRRSTGQISIRLAIAGAMRVCVAISTLTPTGAPAAVTTSTASVTTSSPACLPFQSALAAPRCCYCGVVPLRSGFVPLSVRPRRSAMLLCWRPEATPNLHMPRQIDNRIADRLVSTAISSLDSPRGSKVVCTRRALDAALLAAVREAHEIGFLAGQKEPRAAFAIPVDSDRPAWMDIRFDDPAGLKRHGIRIKPIVRESLVAAGYWCLGDLCWVPDQHLMRLHYVGIKTARALRAIVQRFEAAEPSSEGDGQPAQSAQPIADPASPNVTTDHLFFP